MNYWTPCAESRHCYYNEFRGNNKQTFCRILNDKNGGPPYEDGKCPFYKKDEKSFSGRRNDDGS